MESLAEKLEKLKEYLKEFGSVAVAFSSGVDSAFLLKVAVDTLGRENVVAITATSFVYPKRELVEARELCRQLGVCHIEHEFKVLDIEGFSDNPKERCYICKRCLFEEMLGLTELSGMSALIEGSHKDDEGDYRPGLKAIEELGIISPLRYAELTKEEIRSLSKEMGLPTCDKPSFACLATRFPYGEKIDEKKLAMVEQAEQILYDMGFTQFRVRIHENNGSLLARLELLSDEFQLLFKDNNRIQITSCFSRLGFTYISLDLEGYRTGSMNKLK